MSTDNENTSTEIKLQIDRLVGLREAISLHLSNELNISLDNNTLAGVADAISGIAVSAPEQLDDHIIIPKGYISEDITIPTASGSADVQYGVINESGKFQELDLSVTPPELGEEDDGTFSQSTGLYITGKNEPTYLDLTVINVPPEQMLPGVVAFDAKGERVDGAMPSAEFSVYDNKIKAQTSGYVEEGTTVELATAGDVVISGGVLTVPYGVIEYPGRSVDLPGHADPTISVEDASITIPTGYYSEDVVVDIPLSDGLRQDPAGFITIAPGLVPTTQRYDLAAVTDYSVNVANATVTVQSGTIVGSLTIKLPVADRALTVDNKVTIPAGLVKAQYDVFIEASEKATVDGNVVTIHKGYSFGDSVTVGVAKEGETYTPSDKNQIIRAGSYLTEDQIILGDTNLSPHNIRKDATLFGVVGTYDGDIDFNGVNVTSGDLLADAVAIGSDRKQVTGSIKTRTKSDIATYPGTKVSIPDGYFKDTVEIDAINTSDATADSSKILAGSFAYGLKDDGEIGRVDGDIQTISLSDIQQPVGASVIVPRGYIPEDIQLSAINTDGANALSSKILSGYFAYANGEKVEGNIRTITSSDITNIEGGTKIRVSPGYLESELVLTVYNEAGEGWYNTKDVNAYSGGMRSGTLAIGPNGEEIEGSLDVVEAESIHSNEANNLITVPRGIVETPIVINASDTSDAKANEYQLLSGAVAYANGRRLEGKIATISEGDINTDYGVKVTIPSGYVASPIILTAVNTDDATADSAHILSGYSAYRYGRKVEGNIQTVTAYQSIDGRKVIIPRGFIDVPQQLSIKNSDDATATANQILSGATACVKGELIAGSIKTLTVDNVSVSGGVINLPAGRYTGEGIVKQLDRMPEPVISAGYLVLGSGYSAGSVIEIPRSTVTAEADEYTYTVSPGYVDSEFTYTDTTSAHPAIDSVVAAGYEFFVNGEKHTGTLEESEITETTSAVEISAGIIPTKTTIEKNLVSYGYITEDGKVQVQKEVDGELVDIGDPVDMGVYVVRHGEEEPVYGSEILAGGAYPYAELEKVTAEAEDVAPGKFIVNAAGALLEGSMPEALVTQSGSKITVTAGYLPSKKELDLTSQLSGQITREGRVITVPSGYSSTDRTYIMPKASVAVVGGEVKTTEGFVEAGSIALPASGDISVRNGVVNIGPGFIYETKQIPLTEASVEVVGGKVVISEGYVSQVSEAYVAVSADPYFSDGKVTIPSGYSAVDRVVDVPKARITKYYDAVVIEPGYVSDRVEYQFDLGSGGDVNVDYGVIDDNGKFQLLDVSGEQPVEVGSPESIELAMFSTGRAEPAYVTVDGETSQIVYGIINSNGMFQQLDISDAEPTKVGDPVSLGDNGISMYLTGEPEPEYSSEQSGNANITYGYMDENGEFQALDLSGVNPEILGDPEELTQAVKLYSTGKEEPDYMDEQ